MSNEQRGDRVRLEHTTDEFTDLPAGTYGTVVFVDDTGTVHVRWDTGHQLGLVPGVDRWQRIPTVTPHAEEPAEEVGVHLPGIRPLYGVVMSRTGDEVTVMVYSDRGEALITVAADLCRPWRRK
jgi:hypothetical protein